MEPPRVRKVEIVAQDPSVRRGSKVVTSVISIPHEPLDPGPMGYAVHIVDYDASTGSFYDPARVPNVDVIAAPATVGELLADPEYHAQNVYAIVMHTLSRFEFALGRRVGWGVRGHQLKVVPHAFEEANAFYSPKAEALLFGYRRSKPPMFLCLSHDIVVHETTHALLDGLRERFMAPSSPDQAALHEAFADIIALLSVFSLKDVLGHFIDLMAPKSKRRTPRGMVARKHLTESALTSGVLLGLAEEMRDKNDLTRVNALRRSVDLLESPTVLDQDEFKDEPHRRGEVVVAAFMGAFVKVWAGRAARLGSPRGEYVDRGLAADEGAFIADLLMTMAIRAIDYTPPIHITFGDFVSALVTADSEVRSDDSVYELRAGLLASFLSFGIAPGSAGDAVVAGRWDRPAGVLDHAGLHLIGLQTDETEMFRLIWRNREMLRLHETAFTRVGSVRPCVRVSPEDGFQLRETVIELTQYVSITGSQLGGFGLHKPLGMEDDFEFSLEGGATLILDEYGELKFNISNCLPATTDSDVKKELSQERLQYLWENDFLGRSRTSLSNRLGDLHARRAGGMVIGLPSQHRSPESWS